MNARRAAATLSLLALAALGACGRDGGAGGPAPSSGGAGPSLPPVRDRPDGRGWDALSWAPSSTGGAIAVAVTDLAADRASREAGRPLEHADLSAEGRRWIVRELGLPEEAVRVLVTVREREGDRGPVVRLRAAQVTAALGDVRRAALAHGGVEVEHAGRPAWRTGDAEGPVTAWADGWLLRAEGFEAIDRAFAARRGQGGLRAEEGLAEAVAAVPDVLPVEVEWGPGFGDFGPLKTPPVGAVTVPTRAEGGAEGGLGAMVFRSEADCADAKPRLAEMLKGGPAQGPKPLVNLECRGRVLRMALSMPSDPEALEQRAHEDLRRLHEALEARRAAGGRFPTTAEGLAALAADPAALDPFLGVVPKDPWGRPYHYASPHPTKPDDVDLRSAGPDGEIDTEDDVF